MKCEICGFDRYLEKCHLIPRDLGGGKEIYNQVILCPNHHKLLDWGRLTNIESLPLENKIINLTKRDKVKNNIPQLEYLYWLLGLRKMPPLVQKRYNKLRKNAKKVMFPSYF